MTDDEYLAALGELLALTGIVSGIRLEELSFRLQEDRTAKPAEALLMGPKITLDRLQRLCGMAHKFQCSVQVLLRLRPKLT